MPLFDRGEFKVNCTSALYVAKYLTVKVTVYGAGMQQLSGKETFLWQLVGKNACIPYGNGIGTTSFKYDLGTNYTSIIMILIPFL